MATFEEYQTATKMRDVMERLVRSTMEAQRPRYHYATVTSIDRSARKCAVLFPGEPASVVVNMGSVQPKEAGQIVRVDGLAGDRFIADVMGEVVVVDNTAISTARPSSPVVGQRIYETDTNRPLQWNGSAWRYEGNTIIHPEGVATSAVTTNAGVSGTSTSWTPDFIGKADIYFDAHLDFDTAGATGFVRIQRSVGGGTWTTIADHAYHDMSESEGHAVGGTFPDKGWVPGSSIQYRMVLVISAGSNITLRSDSVFSIYWYGRV